MNQMYVLILLICILLLRGHEDGPLKATLFIMSLHLMFGLTQSFWELLIITGQGNATPQGIAAVILYTSFLRQVYCLNVTPLIFTKIK